MAKRENMDAVAYLFPYVLLIKSNIGTDQSFLFYVFLEENM